MEIRTSLLSFNRTVSKTSLAATQNRTQANWLAFVYVQVNTAPVIK